MATKGHKGEELDSVLLFEDLEVDRRVAPSLVHFTLRASKTDPFRKGVKVVIGRTGNEVALLLAMQYGSRLELVSRAYKTVI